MDNGEPRTLRWARIALVAGALFLGAAAALIVWDASTDDSSPPVITGQ